MRNRAGRLLGVCLSIGAAVAFGLLQFSSRDIVADDARPPAADESNSAGRGRRPDQQPVSSETAAFSTEGVSLLQQPRLRQPVALVSVDNGKLLLTANRRSGTITVIDSECQSVLAEHSLAAPRNARGDTVELSDLAPLPNDEFLLATDERGHQLLLIERRGPELRVIARHDVPPYPVSVRIIEGGRRCCVASLWSRQLTLIDVVSGNSGTPPGLRTAPGLRTSGVLRLPFSPRKQLWLAAARRLIVADAFGGRLAVIDPAQSVIESVRSIPTHNIGGLLLGADGKTLLVSHQILNPQARTDFTDLHWGILLANTVRVLSLEALLDKDAPLLRGSHSVLMGDVGKAGGDPAEIVLGPDGRLIVALSGVGAVAVTQPEQAIQYRIAAGLRPVALLAESDGSRVFAADALGDAVHLLDVIQGETIAVLPLGPRPELTSAQRGEMLFYNARLSHDGWMSCHSCHTGGHTNGLLGDNLGDGSFSAPKRVPSLLGVADTGPWAWNGGVVELETQIGKSVVSTMHGKPLTAEQVGDLAAYLRTLSSPPALKTIRTAAEEAAFVRGGDVFRREECQRCHRPSAYTAAGIYDVGLADELGNSKFNPPSLRGVSQRDMLFHDNRARSLEEVFTKYKHPAGSDLPAEDLSDLLEFLRSL